jgi:hypothetical protein
MIAHAYGIFSDRVDPIDIGRHWSAKAVTMVRKTLALRDSAGDGRFIDVAYADIVRRPVEVLQSIYGRLDLPFGPEDGKRIGRWMTENPQHKYGRHRYHAGDFGLDIAALKKEFAPYIQRFSIPEEDDE